MAKSGFIYSDDNKRYHTQNYHLRHTFGGKVTKISLDAGFTCPNIDGRCGVGGCIYCLDGSGTGSKESLISQFNYEKERMSHKWKSDKFIVYLQAHSNTYAPLDTLKRIYSEVLSFENVVGLSVATRADCIDDDTADLLSEISKTTYLNVELGLQSTFDETAKLINRGHTYDDFLRGVEMMKKRDIKVCVHLINGLPGETYDMMIENVRRVNALDVFSIKLHLLHVLRGTPLEKMYMRGECPTFELDSYVKLICDELEYIKPETVIQRLTGDGDREHLISPLWSMKKFVVLDEIDKELEKRKTFQGIRI
ncbi:MAG: TIGR01212 family radical SAM protein [Clostridia bacterium]|nr:TIGR01212 family radical SAM protein [Clostridia bacterium]